MRFSKLKQYESLDVQHVFEYIQFLKKKDYTKELNEDEIEEIKYYKNLFEDIFNDFYKIRNIK